MSRDPFFPGIRSIAVQMSVVSGKTSDIVSLVTECKCEVCFVSIGSSKSPVRCVIVE